MMSDPAFLWLLQQLQHEPGSNSLWCVDENTTEEWRSLAPTSHIHVVSNRWDLADAMGQAGWHSAFHDFDLRQQAAASLDAVFYRISKEKPLVHHLLNQAWRCLKIGGKLYLSGQKNEGIKTFAEKAADLLGCARQTQKQGLAYSAILTKQGNVTQGRLLDDSDYSTLRVINPESAVPLLSKPGQFGWNKADQGSRFLLEHLPALLRSEQLAPTTCLDLGCGYGYLTLNASKLPECASIQQWLLTDNNAAALLSAQANVDYHQLNAQVVGDDCAAHLREPLDLILCNPPFHQGFNVEGELTGKFIATAQRLLKRGGLALFVVNQFIPLEKKAAGVFRTIKLLADNGSFKLVVLSN
ncbi:methyltransferase [Cellvibrio japonicus]|nr:methyltransferase [Cellvibrio japonicus]QEI12448.1 class I SAM-dependent methyltransferase [Cellvibrio japonicus]QEI16021.1 class I SAM-dependent methyltransferase [Cellvibrio japonicus]QEI19600.1 class I SAM-dependent methyltransferase [Cellvibrio japonicus]